MLFKRILALLVTLLFVFPGPDLAGASHGKPPLTTEQAIAQYNRYYDAYTKDELVKVRQYREAYANIKGSLADQIVERAIWYMENGYMVYGHGRKAYAQTGIVDCSNFTSLVYSDFSYTIPTAVREYGTVGTRVEGVYAKKSGKYWTLQGTENLRPGDLMTWWATSNGQKYISHSAIFMGMINGQPAVIGTRSGNPTAIGIVNDFRFWWGSNFFSVQRVLPEGSWTPGTVINGHAAKSPVIPKNPILPPQKPVIMPDQNVPTSPNPDLAPQPQPQPHPQPQPQPQPPAAQQAQYVTVNSGWVSYRSKPRINSTVLGRLQPGEYAPLIKKYNSYWYEIEVNGTRGYITTNSRYTRVVTR